VSNGSRLFMDETIDYRTREARRFRDILAAILDDLESDNLTEGQRQVARRLSLMCLQADPTRTRRGVTVSGADPAGGSPASTSRRA